MKKYLLFLIILLCNHVQGQEYYKPKIDTTYLSGNWNDLEDSRLMKIVRDFPKICGEEFFTADDAFSKIELMTVSGLTSFNKEANTTIFTEADAVVVAYFCRDIDYSIGNELLEFIFTDEKKAKLALKKIGYLFNKESFDTPIGIKNWYYKQFKNRVYLISSRIPDKYNPVKIELQKRIELELN